MIDVSKIKVSEFKSCHLQPPTAVGHYLVIRFSNITGVLSYASELLYIPEHGWNVRKDIITGKIDTTHRICFDEAFPAFWATVAVEEISDGDK